ncbi:hypothetical protein GCM10025859_47250 [Alicyclobacillus fastidiosus]|nr:hypothetical protein GCM10025859_18280 [Alicyclobacillus fastidiosus]GMA62119.1 hypothetical protein GCM10025859_25590 [Alicyclobacillus fastidiosus]GMA64285.1 hypothetical protein GCM10025859_47250 [Alicyclobacillus fastidiosus]
MRTDALREVGELHNTATDEQQKRPDYLPKCRWLLFTQKVSKRGRRLALWNPKPQEVREYVAREGKFPK